MWKISQKNKNKETEEEEEKKPLQDYFQTRSRSESTQKSGRNL